MKKKGPNMKQTTTSYIQLKTPKELLEHIDNNITTFYEFPDKVRNAGSIKQFKKVLDWSQEIIDLVKYVIWVDRKNSKIVAKMLFNPQPERPTNPLPEVIDVRLNETKNQFRKRMDKYLEQTRNVPIS